MSLPKIEGQEHESTRLERVERNLKNYVILLKVNNSDGCKRSPHTPTSPKGKSLIFHFLPSSLGIPILRIPSSLGIPNLE